MAQSGTYFTNRVPLVKECALTLCKVSRVRSYQTTFKKSLSRAYLYSVFLDVPGSNCKTRVVKGVQSPLTWFLSVRVKVIELCKFKWKSLSRSYISCLYSNDMQWSLTTFLGQRLRSYQTTSNLIHIFSSHSYIWFGSYFSLPVGLWVKGVVDLHLVQNIFSPFGLIWIILHQQSAFGQRMCSHLD